LNVKEVLDKTVEFFRHKQLSSPRLDAEILLSHALGTDRIGLYMRFDAPLNESETETCRQLVRRRSSGEPVAYIVGYKDFFSSRFDVGPGVLIPRPETEAVVDHALERTDADLDLFAEFGVGSGCIGLTILKERPKAKLLAFDVSPEAAAFAVTNAEKLALKERVLVEVQDVGWLSENTEAQKIMALPPEQRLALIVANPPYIDHADPDVEKNVKEFEPGAALFSDENGLKDIRTWATAAAMMLRPGGHYIFEIGYNQKEAATRILETTMIDQLAAFDSIEVRKDLAGHDRTVLARRALNL
jgi:release factor glutamine methyltransferase